MASSTFPHSYHRYTDWWQYGAGWQKVGLLREPSSLWINYLHQRLSFQKRQLFFQGLSWAFLFLILAHCGKNHILSKHASFGISQFASDYLKWKLMWHFKQSMRRPVTQWLHLVSVASWGNQLSVLSLRSPLNTASSTWSHQTFPKWIGIWGSENVC